jgi:hypothetical protein
MQGRPADLMASHRLSVALARPACCVAQGKALLPSSWPSLTCATTSSAQLSSAACRSWHSSASLALGSTTTAGVAAALARAAPPALRLAAALDAGIWWTG